MNAAEIVLLDPLHASAAEVDRVLAGILDGSTPARSIVVPPAVARRCVDALRGRGVRVASVVGYPLGLAKPTVKAIEATSLAKDGVDAVEVTPYPAHVIDGDWDVLREELLEIARGARAARPTLAIDVRVDVAWVKDQGALASIVQRAACDRLIVDRAGSERAFSP